jgi:metal-responsive CopG/Arc/MetJ family transcriptional regulator
MKIKTSITLSAKLLKEVNRYLGKSGNRSAFFEEAIHDYLVQKAHQMREARDFEILNQQTDALNREAKDVLSYQIDL